MTRKEAYEYIKAHTGTANLIKQAEGKNYTNCSTAVLEKWVNNLKHKKEAVIAPTDITPKDVTPKVVNTEEIVNRLIEVLHKKRVLVKPEVNYILS